MKIQDKLSDGRDCMVIIPAGFDPTAENVKVLLKHKLVNKEFWLPADTSAGLVSVFGADNAVRIMEIVATAWRDKCVEVHKFHKEKMDVTQ